MTTTGRREKEGEQTRLTSDHKGVMWAAIRHFLVQPWLPKEMGQQVVKLSLLDTDLRVVNQTFTSY